MKVFLYRVGFISLVLFQFLFVIYYIVIRRSGLSSNTTFSHKVFIPSYFNETLNIATYTSEYSSSHSNGPPPIAFERMLYRYQQYHDSVLSSYVFTKNCFHEKALNGFSKTPQFVVFKAHMYSGYGNIIMGLFSTLLYALLSNRVLLVNWEGGEVGCHASLSQLLKNPSFLSPSHELVWNYGQVKQKSIEQHGCPVERWTFIEKNWLHLESTVYHDRSKPGYRYFKCCKGFAQMLPTSIYQKSENEKFNQINSKDFIEIEGAQYFAPTLYADNDVYYQLFSKLEKKDKDWELRPKLYQINIFSKLAPLLFKPIDLIQQKVDHFKTTMLKDKTNHPESTFLLGIQVRKNEQEYLFHNTPVSIYWECAKQRIMEIRSTSADKYKKVVVFLTSDYAPAFDEAKQFFEELQIPGLTIHLVYLPQNIPKSRSVEAVQHALIDLYLMMDSDDLIVSEKSTYGHIIHGTAGISPLVVRKEGRFAKNPACVRAQNSEPWFHLRARSLERC
ncbi:hypothetical protein C9374_003088 [Naegleria lovaniensis]|uniref:Uncharacterized protein n=1 Tax=Naegleria lovaniensis TaxID=51637 RepID=A0AA88GUD4_NAELO|nr:uncharacterized protein C9374_003088 [Naegleria lovaniensis]KAG2385939.1 hypothetical protein C9374_003088 [Naegleria lovaniensis]